MLCSSMSVISALTGRILQAITGSIRQSGIRASLETRVPLGPDLFHDDQSAGLFTGTIPTRAMVLVNRTSRHDHHQTAESWALPKQIKSSRNHPEAAQHKETWGPWKGSHAPPQGRRFPITWITTITMSLWKMRHTASVQLPGDHW